MPERDGSQVVLDPIGATHRLFGARDGRILSYRVSPPLRGGPRAGARPCPVLVMLPGGPGLDPAAYFAHAHLPGRRQVFLAPRGTGASDPPLIPAGYGLGGHLDDLEDLVAHLGGEPVALLGSGHGARVALAFARAHPGAVERMLLSGGQLGLDHAFQTQLRSVQERFARRAPDGARRLVHAALAEEDLDLATDDPARRTAQVRSWQTHVVRPTAGTRDHLVALGAAPTRFEAAAPAYDELVTGPDLRVDLGRVTTPTLVLAGELDVTVPATHLREVAEAMPHATFSLVEEVGHLVEVEAPRVWRQRVCDFLDREPR